MIFFSATLAVLLTFISFKKIIVLEQLLVRNGVTHAQCSTPPVMIVRSKVFFLPFSTEVVSCMSYTMLQTVPMCSWLIKLFFYLRLWCLCNAVSYNNTNTDKNNNIVRDWQNGAKVLFVKYCVPIRDRERWRVGTEVVETGSTARWVA